jgi:hypothetical protein
MTILFPDFMDNALLGEIATGDVSALRTAIANFEAEIRAVRVSEMVEGEAAPEIATELPAVLPVILGS